MTYTTGLARNEPEANESLAAKITIGRQEQLCLVRGLIPDGLQVQTSLPLAAGEMVRVETETLRECEAVVRQATGLYADLEFLHPGRSGFADGKSVHHRAPRFSLSETARLRIGKHLLQVRTLDISQWGAKLDLSEGIADVDMGEIAVNGMALLTIRGMDVPTLGTVRWTSRSRAGLQFGRTMTASEIRCILQHPQLEERSACLQSGGDFNL
jgi:hypothetical protein